MINTPSRIIKDNEHVLILTTKELKSLRLLIGDINGEGKHLKRLYDIFEVIDAELEESGHFYDPDEWKSQGSIRVK